MSAPGVIIEEKGFPTVSVHPSPTVPVFLGFFHDVDGKRLPLNTGCIEIKNANDLRKKFPNSLNIKVEIENTEDGRVAKVIETGLGKEHGQSAFAIQHYFENGGGPCFILPFASGDDAGFEQYIKDDLAISLIAVPLQTNSVEALYDKLMPLVCDKTGYFLIRHTATPGATPSPPSAPQENCALYYPYLKLATQPWRNDAEIKVTGMDGIPSLAALQIADPTLYKQADAEIKEILKTFADTANPPSAAAAAAYCKTDRERGVWKAPANVVIAGATPDIMVTDTKHGELNDRGINVIRWSDKQSVISGARTCAPDSDDWRYVSVRRLFNKVERDVGELMRRFVFEPNTQTTWTRVKSAIESYLFGIWSQGGLKGAKPEDGYEIAIGKETMSEEDIAAGRMIAKIGLAASRPAEFIVLSFTQELN